MNKSFFILLILVLLFTEAKSQNTIVDKNFQKNHLFLTVGAPNIFIGLSSERLVFDKRNIKILPHFGFGLNIFKPSLGNEFDFQTGLTGLYGKKKHFAEIGCGLIHYLLNQYDIDKENEYIKYKPILYCLIGYRLNFNKNPFAFKVAITPIFFMNKDKWTFFPLAEIGIGYRI